jgi:RNA polymerase sigma factor (sigma-70 family)
LPEKRRTVLEHKYIHGLSLKEMAEKLQLSVEAVESRLRRARRHFAEAHERSRNEV